MIIIRLTFSNIIIILASVIYNAFLFSLDQSPKEHNKRKKVLIKAIYIISFPSQTLHSMRTDRILRFKR